MPTDVDNNWRVFRQLELESLYEMIREDFDSNEAAQRHAEVGWELGIRATLIERGIGHPPASLN